MFEKDSRLQENFVIERPLPMKKNRNKSESLYNYFEIFSSNSKFYFLRSIVKQRLVENRYNKKQLIRKRYMRVNLRSGGMLGGNQGTEGQ